MEVFAAQTNTAAYPGCAARPWAVFGCRFAAAEPARFVVNRLPLCRLRTRSIPDIPLIKLHLVFPQQAPELVLERLGAVMLLLVLDVLRERPDV